MGKEIEHKFLIKNNNYRSLAEGTLYKQGYIPTLNGMTVRVRICGKKGILTFKDHAVGLTRHEFEYEIPREEAEQLLELMCASPKIEKIRYVIPAENGMDGNGRPIDGLHWEVDEFLGDNKGLIIAEIEVPDERTTFSLPEWIGDEVTGDHRYYNSQLCKNPFKNWK